MIIEVLATGARLSEERNFRALVLSSHVERNQITRHLPGCRLDGDHVWLDPRWLVANGHEADAAWMEGFGQMMAYAVKAGWVDGVGAVRVHIEDYVSDAAPGDS